MNENLFQFSLFFISLLPYFARITSIVYCGASILSITIFPRNRFLLHRLMDVGMSIARVLRLTSVMNGMLSKSNGVAGYLLASGGACPRRGWWGYAKFHRAWIPLTTFNCWKTRCSPALGLDSPCISTRGFASCRTIAQSTHREQRWPGSATIRKSSLWTGPASPQT